MEGARERREFEGGRPGEVVGEPENGEEARWVWLAVPKMEERALGCECEWEGDMGSESVLVLAFGGLRCDAPAARVSGDDCDCMLESLDSGPRPSVGGSLPMSIEKPEDAMVGSLGGWYRSVMCNV